MELYKVILEIYLAPRKTIYKCYGPEVRKEAPLALVSLRPALLPGYKYHMIISGCHIGRLLIYGAFSPPLDLSTFQPFHLSFYTTWAVVAGSPLVADTFILQK